MVDILLALFFHISLAHSFISNWLKYAHSTGSKLMNPTGSFFHILLAHLFISKWLKYAHSTGSKFMNPTGSRFHI